MDATSDGATTDGGGSDAGATTLPIYVDGYGAGDSFVAFGGSDTNVSEDTTDTRGGHKSLKVVITTTGGYTGGTIVNSTKLDVSAYNAVTFWAKADAAVTIDKFGSGNDNTASIPYSVETPAVALTTTWQKYILPLPNPAKATSYDGMFHFATGKGAAANNIYLNDVQFEKLDSSTLGAISKVEIDGSAATSSLAAGATLNLKNGPNAVYYTLPMLKLNPVGFGWYDLSSDMPSVATVDANGVISGLTAGTANITAKVDGVTATTGVAVTVVASLPVPTTVAATPTAAASDVIVLYSSAYTAPSAMIVPVDTWKTMWSAGSVMINEMYSVGSTGHIVKQYTGLGYAGVEFFNTPAGAGTNQIDATAMNYFHMDVWTPDSKTFAVKLVDFGANKVYGGGDDSEAQVTFNATSMPVLSDGGWVSLDIPMSAFLMVNAAWNRQHLSQMVLSADGTGTLYIDNVYFHK
jgi:hypothetical protein